METLLINLIGLTAISLIIWWFWLSKRRTTLIKNPRDVVDIVVENNVYLPAEIHGTAGKILTLRFHRKDPSPCAAVLVFSDFDISVELKVNAITEVLITPQIAGNYPFGCENGFYQGVLVVNAPSCCH